MLISIDYDETYTRDPVFWNAFIGLAAKSGHAVICATMRAERDGADIVRDLGHLVESIVFTDGKAKHGAVDAAGFMPSVWIDDSPLSIHVDAAR